MIKTLIPIALMLFACPLQGLAAANITVIKSANKSKVSNLGDKIGYTVAYENKGDATARNFKITDNIPAGTYYVPDSAEPRADFNGQRLLWDVGDVPPGSKGRVSFEVSYGMQTIEIQGDTEIAHGTVQWKDNNFFVHGKVTVKPDGILMIGTTGPAMKAVIAGRTGVPGKLTIESGGQVMIGYKALSGPSQHSTCDTHGNVDISGFLTVDDATMKIVGTYQNEFIYNFEGGTLTTRNNSVIGGAEYNGRSYATGFALSSGEWDLWDTTVENISGIWGSGDALLGTKGVLRAHNIKTGPVADAIHALEGSDIEVWDSKYDILFTIYFTRGLGRNVVLDLPLGQPPEPPIKYWDNSQLDPSYRLVLHNHTIDYNWWLNVDVASKGRAPDSTITLKNAPWLGMHLMAINPRNAPGNLKDFQLPVTWPGGKLPDGKAAPWTGPVPAGHEWDTGNVHWIADRVGGNPANITTWGFYPRGPDTDVVLPGPTNIAELIFYDEGSVAIRGTPGKHDAVAAGQFFVIGPSNSNLTIENALLGLFDAGSRSWAGEFQAWDKSHIQINNSRIGITAMRTMVGGTGAIDGVGDCTVTILPPPGPGEEADYREFENGGLIDVPHDPCPWTVTGVQYGTPIFDGTPQTKSHGDNWGPAWSKDGKLYTTSVDSKGFDNACRWKNQDGNYGHHIVSNQLTGDPNNGDLHGSNIRCLAEYDGQSSNNDHDFDCGRTSCPTPLAQWEGHNLTSVNGDLYAVFTASNYGNATLMKSPAGSSLGNQWCAKGSGCPPAEYNSGTFTSNDGFIAPYFVDYGQDKGLQGNSSWPDEARNYVYAVNYSGDYSGNGDLYLGRVARTEIANQDPANWQFLTNFTEVNGVRTPMWGSISNPKKAFFGPSLDNRLRGKILWPMISWIAPIQKYLMIQWYYDDCVPQDDPGKCAFGGRNITKSNWVAYVSDHIWGPYTQVGSTQHFEPSGLLLPDIPTKFVSQIQQDSNGYYLNLWVISSGDFQYLWQTYYHLNSVPMRLGLTQN